MIGIYFTFKPQKSEVVIRTKTCCFVCYRNEDLFCKKCGSSLSSVTKNIYKTIDYMEVMNNEHFCFHYNKEQVICTSNYYQSKQIDDDYRSNENDFIEINQEYIDKCLIEFNEEHDYDLKRFSELTGIKPDLKFGYVYLND